MAIQCSFATISSIPSHSIIIIISSASYNALRKDPTVRFIVTLILPTCRKRGKAKENKIPPQLSQLLAVATEMGFDVSALVQFTGGVSEAPDEDA